MVDPLIVHNFAIEDQLHFTQYKQSDELLDLMQELTDKIQEIVDNKLTPRQKEVMNKVYREGMTQTEVAKELGLCQPSIHKTIWGNLDFQHNKKRYGGAIKKIRKICANDKVLQLLLTKLEQLKIDMLE